MRNSVFMLVLAALLVLSSATTWARDARHAAFLEAARAFVVDHRLPDGEAIDKSDLTGNFAENQLALSDVDGDGQPELLLRFQSGSEPSQQEFVCGFDEHSGKLTVEYDCLPGASEYYTNGSIRDAAKSGLSLGGDFLPFRVYRYSPKTGKYEYRGYVDAWSKKDFPTGKEDEAFPDAVDATGDGFLYYIEDESFEGAKGLNSPVDTPVYTAWYKRYFSGAQPVKVEWIPADAAGLKALEK